MSQVLFSGGDGNGVYSEDCTATANDILKGKNLSLVILQKDTPTHS
jgi:hypothetical protein